MEESRNGAQQATGRVEMSLRQHLMAFTVSYLRTYLHLNMNHFFSIKEHFYRISLLPMSDGIMQGGGKFFSSTILDECVSDSSVACM